MTERAKLPGNRIVWRLWVQVPRELIAASAAQL